MHGTDELARTGFYTMSDGRARRVAAGGDLRLTRCELVLSARCNFRCPYCRHVGGRDLDYEAAIDVVGRWAHDGLGAVRFSGGEPTLWPRLVDLVSFARTSGIGRIAVSTNGSAAWELYELLTDAGVDDWSVSLDACCAAEGDRMAGGVEGAWQRVIDNIARLARLTYTTVGIVLTADNIDGAARTIELAASLGVSDIRIIPAAQHDDRLRNLEVSDELAAKYPILAYRLANLRAGLTVRGLVPGDSRRCSLVLDDMAINSSKHYPCIIYLRERGEPIGDVGPDMRAQREAFFADHDTHADPICATNCLDVCVAYNNRCRDLRGDPDPA